MSTDTTPALSVHIETFGCQMNVYDTMAIGGLLDEAGFRRVDGAERADAVLLNTCSVREHAEHKVISRIGQLNLRRRRGDGPALIGVCGCMAERLGARLLGLGQPVDLIVGVDQYDRLPAMLGELFAARKAAPRIATGHRGDVHYVAPPEAYPANHSHLVTIHKGCDYRCTYCIVPLTRGRQREKSPEVILQEIRRVVAGGGREVTLLGQNVTAYRWQGEIDFARLLRRVAEVPQLRRIRFLTGHPRDLSEALLQIIADQPKICPALHLPMQSGSDRILRRMKRLYTRAEYLALIDRARGLIPEVTFSSDFIVGFPGETEEDFRATLEAIQQVEYDQVFSFKYSARSGAPAAELPDDVALEVKKQRLAELMDVQARVWHNVASAQVGRIWNVTIEGAARRPPEAWKGRTSNNRKVLLMQPDLELGQECRVRITGCRNTTFTGEILKA